MIESKSISRKIFNVFNIALMAVLALSCLYPLWYALCLSLSSKSAANAGMVTFFPVGFTLTSYKEIMGDWKFFNSFWISIQRTVLGTVFSLLVMILVGYPLARRKRSSAPAMLSCGLSCSAWSLTGVPSPGTSRCRNITLSTAFGGWCWQGGCRSLT